MCKVSVAFRLANVTTLSSFAARTTKLVDAVYASVEFRSLAWCGPPEAALLDLDRNIIDACLSPSRQSGLVELPQFIALASEPSRVGIMPFVLESHCDAVIAESP